MTEDSKDDNDLKNKVLDQLESLKNAKTEELSDADSEIPEFQGLLSEMSAATEISAGSTIGNWKVVKKIGQGGMSSVYLVERNDGQLQQQAALKVIPSGMMNQNLKQRFLRERQILSDLNHPNIAKLYDAGITPEGVPWFVMEYVKGLDIIDYVESRQLNIEQRVMLFRQVCDALKHSHSKGVVHRDIKPNNLIIGEDERIKLLDFGIAASDENDSLTMTGVVIGTPGYLSPEQARGQSHLIDRRSDIFSLGVLLYKLLKNELPFQAQSVSEISYKIINEEPTLMSHEVPADLQAITFKCLEKKVENRYSSLKELMSDLDAYLNGDVIQARKVTWALRLGKKIKKYPLISSLALLALLTVISSLAYGVFKTYQTLKTVQIAEQHLSRAQEIKAKVRRTHMMPKHNVQNEYKLLSSEIDRLRADIESSGSDVTGLGSFALGSAYLSMGDDSRAYQFLKDAERKGWDSIELSAALGLVYAQKWAEILKVSLAMESEKEKQNWLQQNQKIYDEALKHLQNSQSGTSISNYLAARLAHIEQDLDTAIQFIEEEIKTNPWHYEAMMFAATLYDDKYVQVGDQQGYEDALIYKELSDTWLRKAINIGRSDPANYIQQCQNAATHVRQYLNQLTGDIQLKFEMAIQICNDALSLAPGSKQLFLSLGTVYEDMADYLELKKDSFFKMDANSYFISKEGLDVFPEDAQLLAASVSSLFGLAQKMESFFEEEPQLLNKMLQSFDVKSEETSSKAELFFLQALKNIDLALKVNPRSLKFRKKHAEIHRALGIYHEELTSRYDLADFHYDQAMESFRKMEALGGRVASIGNVAEMYYNKALLRNLQGQADESIQFLKKAIEINAQVLDITQAKFAVYNNTMQFHYELIETLVEHNRPYESYLPEYFQFVEEMCQFEYLEELHWYMIDDIMMSYKNLGIDTDNQFPTCTSRNR